MKLKVFMAGEDKRFIGILSLAACVLLIPLVAMQFTDEVKWSRFDFEVAGFLLLGIGSAVEIVLRRAKGFLFRGILCGAVLASLFLIWVELAVGVFGTPYAGN